MNIQFYIEKLNESKEYQTYKKENPESYFCGGFFSFDSKKKEQDKIHMDFFNPKEKEIISFIVNEECKIEKNEFKDQAQPEEISQEIDIDFDRIIDTIEDARDRNKVTNNTEKFLLSLQKLKDEDYIVATVFLSGFGILKLNVKLSDLTVADFEKKSFMDFLKISGKKKESKEANKKE